MYSVMDCAGDGAARLISQAGRHRKQMRSRFLSSHSTTSQHTTDFDPAYRGGIISGMPDPQARADFYCPVCAKPVSEPLLCGDCHALICRDCGTPLERIDDLGIG
jgi:hypothetical protein